MPASKLIAEMTAEQRRAERERTPEAMLAVALALGQEAVETFASVEGCSRGEARRRMRNARQRGRLPSRVMVER